MAGWAAYFNGYNLADGTNVIASDGDIQSGNVDVTSRTYAGIQYQTETAVTSSAAAVDLGACKCRYYHNLTEDTTIGVPTGLANGQTFSIRIEANGTHEASWNAYYLWDTNGEPDCSAQDDGDMVIVDCYVVSATAILAFASPWYEV